MGSIDYRRHFALLLVAMLILRFVVQPVASRLPMLGAPLVNDSYFGLIGVLNAASWVLALRVSVPARRRVAFLLVAVVLSMAAPYAGLALASLLPSTSNDIVFFSQWAAGSAVGAATYWLAIRTFWLPSLALVWVVPSVVACVVATIAALWTGAIVTGFGSRPNELSLDLQTYFWWVAFSLSLLAAGLANRRLQPTAPVPS
jgi:hypothetical protein